MKQRRRLATISFLVLGGLFFAVGGDLANWWTLSAELDCTRSASECEEQERIGLAIAGVALLIWLVALAMHLRWTRKRGAHRRLVETGTRVPAVLTRFKRYAGGQGSSSSYKQWWEAQAPDGPIEFKVRCTRYLEEGYVLEAVTAQGRAALVLDLEDSDVTENDQLLGASHQAAQALRGA